MKLNDEILAEKHSSKRLKAEMRVYYGATPKTLLSGFSVDLSTGGLYLKTTFPFEVDEELILKFSFLGQEEKAVSYRARVAWVNHQNNPHKPESPPGVGVQFVDLSPENLTSILSFIEMEAVW
jgi:uncharacterized protein (TIGR02266 family)